MHPFFDLPHPIVFGHRGASGELPENTLPAFRRALAQGADVIETDVHQSRDGQVVIAHDADLARTTGRAGQIAELDLAQIQARDAGYAFGLGAGHPFRGHGLRVPTLREAFEALPGARFNIEIKRCAPALVAATLDLVAEFGRAERTLLAAGEDDTMALLRAEISRRAGLAQRAQQAPRAHPALGAATGEVLAALRAMQSGAAPPPGPMALQIPPEFAGQPLVTAELIAFAHAHRLEVHVWTVNDESEMQRLLALGVDGLMSDFPARLRAIVQNHKPK